MNSFSQSTSSVIRLFRCAVLSIVLMVADLHLNWMSVVRSTLATAVYPVELLVLQPVHWLQSYKSYFSDVVDLRSAQEDVNKHKLLQSILVNKAEELQLENNHLRELLNFKKSVAPEGVAAEVVYDAPDPYSRRVIINRGSLDHVQAGAPVVDSSGLLGQVTRVHLLTSEVTLLTDPNQLTPVIDTRSGVLGAVTGSSFHAYDGINFRYVSKLSDVQVGDGLSTSGINGVYPAGLKVGVVKSVEPPGNSMFLRIACKPVAFVQGVHLVLVLKPRSDSLLSSAGASDVNVNKPPAVKVETMASFSAKKEETR